MKTPLIGLAICIAAIYFGNKLSELKTIKLSQADMDKLHNLCSQKNTTFGYPDSVFEVTEIRLGKLKTKQYSLNYFFFVDGKDYSIKVTRQKEPTNDSIEIWYDKNNPAVSKAGDPCAEIDRLAKQKIYPDYYSTTGNILFIAGILLGLGFLRVFLRKLFTRKPTTIQINKGGPR